MSYDRNPPAPERFFEDHVVPVHDFVFVWFPTIAWFCFPPVERYA